VKSSPAIDTGVPAGNDQDGQTPLRSVEPSDDASAAAAMASPTEHAQGAAGSAESLASTVEEHTEQQAMPSPEQRHAAEVESLQATLLIAADGLPSDKPDSSEPSGATAPQKLKLKLKAEAAALPHPESKPETLREETLRLIANLAQAPAMSWLADNLIRVMARKDVDLEDVAEAVAKDPAISARILRMANSPVIGSVQRVVDIKTGVSLLGVQRVRLTAQALVTLQDTGRIVEGFNWRHLWIHSFACGLLAAEIPRQLRLNVSQDSYLAGLLHDLGKILLSHLNPQRYRLMLMEAVCDGTPLHELEFKHFGLTHEEAGAEFARVNKLGPTIANAIRWHALPAQAEEEHRLLTACISVANYLAKLHGLGFSGSPLSQMEEHLGQTEGWGIIAAAALRAPDAEDFHLQLRPFIADLKHELHSWAHEKLED